jgi:type VI secretion system protein ImpH
MLSSCYPGSTINNSQKDASRTIAQVCDACLPDRQATKDAPCFAAGFINTFIDKTTMKSSDLSHTMFADFENDFKAEVIAAELVENGTPADRLLILMLGALKRTFSKDVQAIEEELSDYDHREYVLVKTHKEGIYDMLPEGLFHHPTMHKSAKTEKEIIKLMKRRRAEEQNARKFFLPFETAINNLRMQMALYENRLDKRSHYDDLVDIFRDHWEIFSYLDAKQANIFLHLVPVIHDLRDNHPAIESIFEMIFLLPVQVILRNQWPLHPSEPMLSKLGDSNLGVNLTTGNAIYDEGVDEILVKVGPVTKEIFKSFMPGGNNKKILELLCDHLLPVHLDIVTEIVMEDNDKIMRLADEENELNSVLGWDAYL